MKRIVTTYDMMISSPSDTAEEIEAVFESVMSFNRITARQKDPAVMVRIVRWNTDVFMNSGKIPQASINEQIVEECDFAVVIFRHRLGTAVGRDKSGTAQEIRLLKKKKKQVFVFCLSKDAKVDLPKGKDAAETEEIEKQYSELQSYISGLKKTGIPVFTYTSAADLQNQLSNQLSMFALLKNVPDLQKADDLGIWAISKGGAGREKLEKKIECARHVKIFHTTGRSFFHAYTEQLVRLIRNNGTLQVLLPNPYSEFLNDVNRVEQRSDENNISKEFAATMDYIRKIWKEANRTDCNTMGKIWIGCARTMLRQTEIICIGKEDESDADEQIWCWVTVTMPPGRASGESLSLECRTVEKEDSSLAAWTNTNFDRCWEEADDKIEFDGKKNIPYFYKEKHHAEEFWEKQLAIAKDCARKAQNDRRRSGILIEVAAQHPLESDGTPGVEFAKRLDMGYEIYNRKREQHIRCRLYIPGSLHMHNGIEDKVSLSEAGRKYLLEKGVPPEDMYGEPENTKYRGDDGVYNSADECFVASKIWEEEGFSELFCVCSPMQSMRKMAHYIALGAYPSVFTCPSSEMFHDYVYEMFTALPDVLYKDPDLDPGKSELAGKYRQERKPGFRWGQRDGRRDS